MTSVETKRPYVPQYVIRSLASPVLAVTEEYRAMSTPLAVLGRILAERAQQFSELYDRRRALAAENRQRASGVERALEDLKAVAAGWGLVLRALDRSFDPAQFGPTRATAAEQIRAASELCEHIKARPDLAFPEHQAAIDELGRAITDADQRETERKRSEHEEQRLAAEVRTLSREFLSTLSAYGRLLSQSFGRRYLAYRELDPLRYRRGGAGVEPPSVEVDEDLSDSPVTRPREVDSDNTIVLGEGSWYCTGVAHSGSRGPQPAKSGVPPSAAHSASDRSPPLLGPPPLPENARNCPWTVAVSIGSSGNTG